MNSHFFLFLLKPALPAILHKSVSTVHDMLLTRNFYYTPKTTTPVSPIPHRYEPIDVNNSTENTVTPTNANDPLRNLNVSQQFIYVAHTELQAINATARKSDGSTVITSNVN
jgi:hypothetical protein